VEMGVHDWACPGVLVAHQRASACRKSISREPTT
jgi:hypothetical protein